MATVLYCNIIKKSVNRTFTAWSSFAVDTKTLKYLASNALLSRIYCLGFKYRAYFDCPILDFDHKFCIILLFV